MLGIVRKAKVDLSILLNIITSLKSVFEAKYMYQSLLELTRK